MFTVGLQANSEAIVIPPAQTTYSLSMTCQSDCMSVFYFKIIEFKMIFIYFYLFFEAIN